MSSEENSIEEIDNEFVVGPAYALMIGISKYSNGQQPNETLQAQNFTILKYAEKDARDFATFLEDKGFYDCNVRYLYDAEATRTNIITELDELARRCTTGDPDPLVIVYFSGHGWPSPDGKRNYLVPYDARRDKLAGTAIDNEEFSKWLSDVPTNRLIVFIDACHSGDIGVEGRKGTATTYSHAGLGEGAGRYLIASCSANEQSYEDEGNGIFTKNLLMLLRGETNDIQEEEIKTTNLIEPLSRRVQHAAYEKYQRNQTLTQTVDQGQGITLAINKRVRLERKQKQTQAKKEALDFLDVITVGIRRTDSKAKTILVFRLRRYVETGKRDAGYDELYSYFDENFSLWVEKRAIPLEVCVGYLIEIHDGVLNAPPPPPPEENSQLPAKGADNFVPSATPSVLPVKVTAPQPMAPPSTGQELRQFSSEDQEYILKDIITKLAYYNDAKPLIEELSRPVSEGAFVRLIHLARLKKENDQQLSVILDDIVSRFQEKWQQSPVVAAATVSDLRFS